MGLASDDELIETLVLKGGNAIEIGYAETIGSVSRPSLDLDFSISGGDFKGSIDSVSQRMERALSQSFNENGFQLFDFKFFHKPRKASEETPEGWGGYMAEFKLISLELYESFRGDIDKVRRNAIPINPSGGSTRFEIDFSKSDYTEGSRTIDVNGYQIKVYTPEMIVFEKLRALCQQLPRYGEIIGGFVPRARARDFYDIWLIMENLNISLEKSENLELIRAIFSAKKVPLELINDLRTNKEIHMENWSDVRETLSVSERVGGFDFYFDFVLSRFENLKFP